MRFPAFLQIINDARGQLGQSLVEFALTLPFLIMLIVGTFDLGWAVYAKNTVALSAREGARLGIILSTTDDQIRSQVKNTSQGMNIPDGNITITPSATRTSGSSITVAVKYSWTPVTPLIPNIIGNSGHLDLTSTATMYVE